jgi:hypothetical protein
MRCEGASSSAEAAGAVDEVSLESGLGDCVAINGPINLTEFKVISAPMRNRSGREGQSAYRIRGAIFGHLGIRIKEHDDKQRERGLGWSAESNVV